MQRLLFCVFGIYVCYLSYGIFQEKIFKYRDGNGRRFSATLFLLCLQCFGNGAIAFGCKLGFSTKTKSTATLFPFAFTAMTYLGAMLCSNEALKHVSYPTQALAKSCKMIPVMVMGVIIRKKKYSLKEYLTVFTITIGIALFQYGKLSGKASSMKEENSSFGLMLLFISLALDGMTGPKQEVLNAKYHPTVHEIMLYTNIWAFLYTLCGCIITGQGMEGLVYIMENASELAMPLLGFAICSALGQNFIFYTIQQFSALACTTITTTRKFFTILVSVVLYNHQLTKMSWIGVLLVFTGLIVELSSKYQKHHTKSA